MYPKKNKEFDYANPSLQFIGYASGSFICGGRSCGKTYLTNHTRQDSHTELCPVCHGTGKYIEHHFARGQSTGNFDYSFTRTCHGCGGKGWVVVYYTYGMR